MKANTVQSPRSFATRSRGRRRYLDYRNHFIMLSILIVAYLGIFWEQLRGKGNSKEKPEIYLLTAVVMMLGNVGLFIAMRRADRRARFVEPHPHTVRTSPATRKLRKTLPMPEDRANLDFVESYSISEFELMKRGLIPEGMEDKWFIFFEEPWLYFHRGWTGTSILVSVLSVQPAERQLWSHG